MIAYEEVETAAKAIFEADDAAPNKEWGVVDQEVRNFYLKLAKAATDALGRQTPSDYGTNPTWPGHGAGND